MTGKIIAIGITLCVLPLPMASAGGVPDEPTVDPTSASAGGVPDEPTVDPASASVMSATGTSYIVGEGGKRKVACKEIIGVGERIVSEEGARVGVAVGDVYMQLDDANVAVGLTAAGAPSLDVDSGRVRLLDSRPDATSPLAIRTPHCESHGLGTDTEMWVSELSTELCENAARLDVTARPGNESVMVKPGECVTLPAGGSPVVSARGAGGVPE
jgi:hypothetical protein